MGKIIHVNALKTTQTLLAHLSPHELHSVLGPAGPRSIIGVDFELIPQYVHLNEYDIKDQIATKTSKLV